MSAGPTAGSAGSLPRVLVLGAGPVGQSAALLLARWGIPVTVVDQRPARDAVGSKAICQQRDVLDIWDSVGVGAQVAAEGVTWTTARTFYQATELFSYEFVDRGRSPFPPFVNISQSRTEELLDTALAAQPLVDVRLGVRVDAIDQDAESVTLTGEVGGRTEVLHGSYAVACGGARGDTVRRALGVSFDGVTFADQFLICDIRATLPGWERERRFYFDPVWNPGRQVLIHPCPDSTYRIDWQVPPEFDLAAEQASGALDARIRAVIGERPYEVVWQSVYRFHSRRADRFRAGRVLLAGDCAHLVAPFGARGLNSGVPDVENAAWKLAFVLRGWAPDALLDSYDSERGAAADENLEVTGATMRFLVPQSEAEWELRRSTLEAAVDEPSARAGIDSGRFAEPYWYVDSPLTTPDPTRRPAGRPPRGQTPPPGAGVLVPDLPLMLPGDSTPTRLGIVARQGVLALCGAGVDPATIRSVVSEVTPAPVMVLSVPEIDCEGVICATLDVRDPEVWLLRPDAHVAAIVAVDEVAHALRRMLALSAPATPLATPLQGGDRDGLLPAGR